MTRGIASLPHWTPEQIDLAALLAYRVDGIRQDIKAFYDDLGEADLEEVEAVIMIAWVHGLDAYVECGQALYKRIEEAIT